MCFREFLKNIILNDNLKTFIDNINKPEQLPIDDCEYDEYEKCICGDCKDFNCIKCVLLFSLFESINENAIKIFTYLMSSNILNEKNQYNQTPLHCAVDFNRIEMVKLLLQHKANVNELDFSGQIPLHYASINGNDEIVKLLLKYNSSLDRRDDSGVSPLGYAVFNNNLSTCRLLLKYGANINQKDYDGMSPLKWAEKFNYKKIYRIFLETIN